jgi:hypothetical protein
VSTKIVAAALVVAACTGAAFLLLDPVVAAFVAILLVTGLCVGFAARDWDQHSTFEEREQARAERRLEKWDRSKDVRDRDRARWEAYQARQAQQTHEQ